MSSPTFFATADAFRSWLATNAGSASELLVGYHKVGSGVPSMSWPDSVDQALCFGWIDGVRRRIDDSRYSIRFTPRKAESIWSVVNIARYQKLLGAGLITPAGAAAFAHRTDAKTAVYAYEQSTVAELAPEELRLFQLQPVAWAYFRATPPSYRKVILHWITSAKKDQTRSARFAQLLTACAEGLRLR
jgi:uncharacterized protein YdeI (YjbR/CyaY-like superfamily)